MKRLLVSTAMAATLLVGVGAGNASAKDPGVVTSSISQETEKNLAPGYIIYKRDPGVVTS